MGKTDIITAYTDAEGKYSTTSILCNYDTETTYNAEIKVLDNLNDIIKDTTLLLDSNNKTINLTTCDGTVETVSERIFDGDYVIDSEDSYLAFIETGFTKVTGGLTISNITATDLTAFSTLTSVGGLLIQENEFLTSLEGLENVTDIDFGITIIRNPNLVSLVNFSESIDFINSLEISFNDKLINIDGFKNIEIGGPYTTTNGEIIDYTALAIKNNLALTNISAFKNNINDSIGGLIFIENNEKLETLSGLEGITQASWVSIRGNSLLENLDELSDITYINILDIDFNDNLISLIGLSNVTYINRLTIGFNDNLKDYCSLNINMISLITDAGNQPNFQIYDNAYNPTKQDLLDGNCSE